MWEELQALYHTAIEERADVRTQDWFLVHSPWPPFCILVLYLAFCAKSQSLMKNIRPFELRYVLIIYNFSLVILSIYMAYEFFMSSYLAGYSLLCQPVDYSTKPLAMRMASVCWWYFFSKYIELLDTVFFVMRKKFSQVSFLHIFHHSTMLINWWLAIKYVAGGQSFFIGLINSSVHVVMYSYYGLSCFGPKVRKYLWWKKYLTKLQLIQFVAIFVHCAHNLCADCDYPDWLNEMVMGYMIILIVLFTNFYIQSYAKKTIKKQK
uniref:Elongation of very long chain fatty acids protein n=1 Tax=Phallusia mammillata TaxID=59560 RepID=A0A6F9DCF5_9ASCI|nr:elongation of very long chain fatty acids protein 4-like [Phallusia mammillata]